LPWIPVWDSCLLMALLEAWFYLTSTCVFTAYLSYLWSLSQAGLNYFCFLTWSPLHSFLLESILPSPPNALSSNPVYWSGLCSPTCRGSPLPAKHICVALTQCMRMDPSYVMGAMSCLSNPPFCGRDAWQLSWLLWGCALRDGWFGWLVTSLKFRSTWNFGIWPYLETAFTDTAS
jgi:hypothetical protein